MTPEIIEKLAKWGPQHEVPTQKGSRLLRKAKDTPAFAALWERKSSELYSMGLVRKKLKGRRNKDGSDKFELLWWSLLPPEVVLSRQQSLAKSHSADADVRIPIPPGLSYLGYQKAGIAYACEREGTLIADEMGLGKTIQAIGVINNTPSINRVLVVCPAHLKIKWHRELRKWLVNLKLSIGIAEGGCFPSTDVVIINFQILSRFPKKLEFYWDLVIVDEAHELRNPKAQRTKAVLGYQVTRKEKAQGMISTSGVPAKVRLMLSGTPMANQPMEMYPLLHWLNPKVFSSKWDYAKRFCGWTPGGGLGGATNEAQLGELLRSTCMIRRLKKDVLTELPAKRREVIELPAGKVMEVHAENKALTQFIDGLAKMKAAVEIAKASGDEEQYQTATDNLRKGMTDMNSQLAVIRQQTALAKIPFVVEHIKPLIDEGNKVILFGVHREVVLKYHQEFPGSVMIRGGVSDIDKTRAVDAFQNNAACNLIVGNMSAMGTGLDLTAGNIVVFAEESWLPLEISQCEDRAHRIGQINSVFVQHIVLEGSIDCRMAYATIAKQEIFERILDGRTREEVAREPLIPMPEGVTVTLAEIKAEARLIGDGQLAALNRAVQILSNVERGLNIIDVKIITSLAGYLRMTQAQGVLAKRLANRYRAQLPRDLVTSCIGSGFSDEEPNNVPRETISPQPETKPAIRATHGHSYATNAHRIDTDGRQLLLV